METSHSKREVVNLDQISQNIQEQYRNFVINDVNESCLRIAVFTGDYKWHYHSKSDELFIVLEGELLIDFKDRETVSLKPHEMITIPAGVIHRTRANVRTVNLCFEHMDADTVDVE
ncbi:cupin domain-containing protein [Paenibacillus xylanilyticus]|uniref:cupin domain-containing protein n=1 Tax=Paenibacillus xylanilyticus TaxID=248903 RepID=UPI0039A111DB